MSHKLNQIIYKDIQELVNEWQERSDLKIWDWLELTESQFREWMRKRMVGEIEA